VDDEEVADLVDEEFEGAELDEEDLADLDEEIDDSFEEDFDGDDDADLADDEIDVDGGEADATAAPVPAVSSTTEEDDDDDDDELDPDDVEASLDVILKDRLVIEDVEDDDDDQPETDDRGEGNSVVVPKRPDEFVCQSCFMVKHPSQLANAKKSLCRDCV
jgi:hypothetical protein